MTHRNMLSSVTFPYFIHVSSLQAYEFVLAQQAHLVY